MENNTNLEKYDWDFGPDDPIEYFDPTKSY